MTDERTAEQIQQDEQYYDSLISMMATEGWNNLVSELEATRTVLNAVTTVKTEEELWTRKGQLNIIGNLLGLRTSIDIALAQREADNSNEDN